MSDVVTPDYLQLLRLDGRGYVVLGTGAGIGGQVCHALAQAGAQLLCVDHSIEAAEAAAAATGGIAMAADITSRADMTRVFDRARAEFGDAFFGVVDVVGVPVPGAIETVTDEGFARQIDLVLRHAWLTVQIAAPMLAEAGRGSIIFIGSLAGLQSVPNVGMYSMAKAGLFAMAKSAAHQFGPSGVRVNVVAPGRIRGSGAIRPPEDYWPKIGAGIPLRRVGEPHEIASAVLFMASDLASYVTGEILLVDGGVFNVTALPSTPMKSAD